MSMLVMTCQILFLGAPIFLAAFVHGICMKYNLIPWLKKPMDFGKTCRGKRVFGDHKTWRGPFVYVIMCFLTALIQTWLQGRDYLPEWLFLVDYLEIGYMVGILLGLGMALGELPNSFIKRQLGIAPGKKKTGFLGILFFLFDQVDLAIGIWIFLFFIIRPPLSLVVWSFFITFLFHVGISSLGYVLGMRETIL